MQLGRVIGYATATMKHASLNGWRLLVVQPLGNQGGPDGEPQLALDHLGGGKGDKVILTSDGSAVRHCRIQYDSCTLDCDRFSRYMNVDAVTIERMVREVLEQVQHPVGVRTNIAAASNTLLTVPTAPMIPGQTATAPSSAVVIPDRIVTADVLKEQARSGSKVVISKKAILTPAAQDYVRNNRISVERSDTSPTGNSVAVVRWKIVLSSVAEHTARAIDAVCQRQNTVQRELSGNATEAAAAAVSAISRSEVAGVIVVTAAPQLVACRANRNVAVRAAVVSDLASWQQVQPQLRPNVVCISPHGRGFMELQNVINKVLTSSAPEVPADWS